ncbi:MAG: B12-binding domain-containing radical SAM protein [Acidobacteriota bacterium]
MRVALVNTNRMRPPIAPIGLDYVAEALNAAGHHVELLDLCWEEDARAAIARVLDGADFGLVGVTLRNTDDCAFTSRQSFLGEFAAVVETIRGHTDAPTVLGGVGFSVMPERVLALTNADAGIWGEGEFVLPELATRLERKQEWRDLPNLVLGRDGSWQRNPAATWSLDRLPPMSRTWVDNRRYFREGGQAGFETKRGCPARCIYCADPVAKGEQTRTRPPAEVTDELERLLEQGIDHLHTCDSEFNLPAWHALAVCREIGARGLGAKLRWYAYCSPAPFTRELARAMRDAGCVGINFGVDNGDDEMLTRLRRGFTSADILNAARWSKEAGMAVMLDLLLGSPGETRESLARTVEMVKRSEADRAGVSLGVRVYPGTELARRVTAPGGLVEDAEPLFYLAPEIAPFAFELLDTLIGDDRRFFFFDPSRPERNYNYNANQRLVDAIRAGHRGAYWDILRRYE